MKPWEQEEGEPNGAYQAARIYFELGPKRSLLGATIGLANHQASPEKPQKAPKSPSGSVKKWAKRWRWAERARAYNENLDQVRDQASEVEVANQAVVLEQRRAKIAETGWQVAQQVILKGLEMLRQPLTEQTSQTTVSPDGRTTTVITHNATNWRMRDAAAFLKFGDDLAQISVGLPNRIAVPTLPRSLAEPPVDQVQADAANQRVSPALAAKWRQLVAEECLAHEGLVDAQPIE